MVFLIEKYNDNNNKLQNVPSEKKDQFEQTIENYIISNDPLNFKNDSKTYLYYAGNNKQEEESLDNFDEDNNSSSGRLSAKILIKNDSDEEFDYFANYLKQQQQQQQNQLKLIPFKRRNSVSFTSISTSSTSSTSSSSSFSIPTDYGIRVNVNEIEMIDDERSIATIDTSSPNYQMKINFITDEKLVCIQNELINQIMTDIDFKHQLLNKNITSYVSNCGDLKFNELFLIYLLQKLNLIDLLLINQSLDNGGFYLNETIYLLKRNDFMKKLNRLLMCLNKMEKEFYFNFSNPQSSTALLTSEHLFDANFFLNLSFLVYEQADSLTSRNLFNQKFISDDNLFEMDEQDTTNNEKLYEENLNIVIINFILKNLPDLIKLPCFSGKLIIQFFVNLFENDFNLNINQTECDQQHNRNDYIDINNYMSKPFLSNEKIDFIVSNPITQSFKPFLTNLNALNYQTHDPFIEAKQNDIMTMDYNNFHSNNKNRNDFNQNNNMSARLAFSYYTMGYFEVEKNLFDNPYQSIYDTKEFNNEFDELFQKNSFNNVPAQMNKLNLNKSSKSIWSNIPNQCLSNQISTETKSENNGDDVLEEIINRISTLNTSSLFDSYFKIISDSYLKDASTMKNVKPVKDNNNCGCCLANNTNTNSTSKETTNTRNWTVAPKLLPTNTISNCKSRTIQSLPTLSNSSNFEDSSIIYKSQSDLINNWNRKADLRPIGTKPVSMYTTPNSTNRFGMNKYQKYINNPLLSSNIKKNSSSSIMFNEQIKDDKNIWNSNYNNINDGDEKLSSNFTSPFISYHYSSKGSVLDEFITSCENIKQNNNKMQIMNLNFNNSKQMSINKSSFSNINSSVNNSGRYSVAPMNYSKKMSDQMNDYRQMSFNTNNKPIDLNHHARSSSSSHWSSNVNAKSSPINHSNFTAYNRQPRLSEPNIQFLKDENIMPNPTSSKPSKTVYSISKDPYGINQSYKYSGNKQKVYEYETNKYSSSYDENNDRYFNQISNGNDYGNERYGKSNMSNNSKKYQGNNYRGKGNQRI